MPHVTIFFPSTGDCFTVAQFFGGSQPGVVHPGQLPRLTADPQPLGQFLPLGLRGPSGEAGQERLTILDQLCSIWHLGQGNYQNHDYFLKSSFCYN